MLFKVMNNEHLHAVAHTDKTIKKMKFKVLSSTIQFWINSSQFSFLVPLSKANFQYHCKKRRGQKFSRNDVDGIVHNWEHFMLME